MGKIKPSVVYLDNNATTELSQDVSGVIMDMISMNIYGNPSSQHELGNKIKTLLDAARYGVAQSLGCSSEEIIFTSGGTESNNLALRGTYRHEPGMANGIVISAAEHSSVSSTVKAIADEGHVRLIPLNADGSLDLERAERLITEDTALVSVMLANNETGVLFPVQKIVELAHKQGALVHCDAVQAYGKIPIKVRELGVDLLSVSGHKVHALPGTGALFIRKGVLVHPIITGGRQESTLRGGTENYVGIASLGTAANEITRLKGSMESGLRDAFETGILRRIPDIEINGQEVPRIPNTSSVTFKGIHSMSMLTALSEHGIHASAGPACSTGSTKPSHTLQAMGCSEESMVSTIRFSFSRMSKLMDAVMAIEACVKCAKLLRQSADYKGSKK